MTAKQPVEFVRQGEGGTDRRVGNRVQLELSDGQQVNANRPLPVDLVSDSVWNFAQISDETLNSSNKIISAPAGEIWQILSIYAELTTTATVGTRQLEVRLRDALNDAFASVVSGATQDDSRTRHYMFAPALADLLAFRDTDYLMTPFHPTAFLTPGEDIRVFDNKAIDPGADDLILHVRYAWRSTT